MPVPALSMYRPVAGAHKRIIAFPHAGGGASAFFKLRIALAGHGVELCALQAPGRENRMNEPRHETAEAMAEEFASAIETLPPLPTAFLGHSFGALTGYLTARLLGAKGRAPEAVIASGSLSPSLRSGHRDEDAGEDFATRITSLGGIPDAIAADRDLMEMFEAIIKADIKLSDRYRHVQASPLACQIIVYSGTEDRAARPEFATAWQDLTERKLRTRSFEGGHFFIYADAQKTAAAMLEDLGWAIRP